MLVRSHHQNSQGCKASICECGFTFGSGNGFPVWEAVRSEVTFPSLKKYLFSFNYDFNYKRKRSRSPPDRSCWYGRGRVVEGRGRDGNFWPAPTLTPNHIVALVCCWSSRSTPRSEGEGRGYPWEWTHAMAPRFHPEARVLFCVGSYGALNFLNPKNSSFDNNIGLWFFPERCCCLCLSAGGREPDYTYLSTSCIQAQLDSTAAPRGWWCLALPYRRKAEACKKWTAEL